MASVLSNTRVAIVLALTISAGWSMFCLFVYYDNQAIHWRPLRVKVTFEKPKFRSWQQGLVTILQPQIQKDCQELFKGNESEVTTLKENLRHWQNGLNDSDLLAKTSDCSWVRNYFYNNLYTTQLELSFPVAFTFLIYNKAQQTMRLLKLLYRPHNQYCISPDKKSGTVFIEIFSNLAKCLDNVHIVSTLRDVKWGHYSIMESQMCCFKDLMQIREKQAQKDKWKYVINLCGKELPLTTNHEIVSHLVKLDGTSMIEAEIVQKNEYKFLIRLKKPIPYNISYAKSSTYMCLSPEFIEYLFTNKTAINLFEYFKGNYIPEEHFFPTVYMMPGVPGGFNSVIINKHKFRISRYAWILRNGDREKTQCHGQVVHAICIVESGDLIWLARNMSEKALFQNKYFMENDHVVMDCMEERIIAKNKLEYETDLM